MTGTKCYIAYDASKDDKIYHNGIAIEGTAFTTGIPTVEWFAANKDYLARLDELGIEHGEEVEPDLEEIKTNLLSKLRDIRDKKRDSGVYTQGHKFFTDKGSVNDLALKTLEYISMGATDETPFSNWKCMDGWYTGWTLGEAKQAILVISTFVQNAYDAEMMARDYITNETNVYVLQFKTVEQIFNKCFNLL